MDGLIEFKKVPFEFFFAESKATGFLDEDVPEALVYTVWKNLKQPRRITLMTYEIYSPWSFYLAKGHKTTIPTGFEINMNHNIVPIFGSKEFIITSNMKNNQPLTLMLTAKANTCINEGDPIVKYTLGEENDAS